MRLTVILQVWIIRDDHNGDKSLCALCLKSDWLAGWLEHNKAMNDDDDTHSTVLMLNIIFYEN